LRCPRLRQSFGLDSSREAEAGAGRCDCDPAYREESGLAPSIELAAGQLTAPARYGTARRFGETLDSIRMPLALLNFVEPVVVHTIFLVRFDQAEVSL